MDLSVNGDAHELTVDPETPLLSVLRNDLGLMGAKRGCAQEQCYACCVLLDGRAQPSCQIPVGQVETMEVTTVEALPELQEFFLAEQAGQCGFCIAGMIVAAQGLLNTTRYPSDAQIREALDTNLCRCGVYDRVRRAIRFRIGQPEDRIWEVRCQPPLDDAAPERLSPSLRKNPQLDSWIRVESDETITVFTGKAELGQGITTAIARIAADELGVDIGRIDVVTADTAATPDEGVTAGSLSIEHSGGAVRVAAAMARSMMVERAAGDLGALGGTLQIDDGTITDPATGNSTTYWALQGGRPFGAVLDAALPAGSGAEALDVDADTARVDLPGKVSGRPSYVHDLRFDDMAHARVVRPPHYEARLEAVDISTTQSMAGVVAVVRDGSFLGVVAEREEEAEAAAGQLASDATWVGESDIPFSTDDLVDAPTADYGVVDGLPVDDSIESPSQRPDGSFDVAATYSRPFTMHGSLGPSAAAAAFSADGEHLTLWSPTQGAFPLRESIAEVLGMAVDDIRVVHAEGAGCYGHNGADDVSFDAALLARAVPGRPVLLVWTRADEHRWEPYGPAMVMSLAGDVVADRVGTLDFENWSYTHSARPRPKGDGSSQLLASWHLADSWERPVPEPQSARHTGAHRNADPLYSIPRTRIRTHLVPSRSIRTSSLRSLGAFGNVYALESFIDELADHAGIDPVQLRLNSLDDERARAVIETAAEAAEWPAERPVDSGRGIGFGQYKNIQTYFAVVVELSVDRTTGLIQIDRAVVAADAGRLVSPDGVSNQLEGGVVQAASWTLKESVKLDSREVISEDWETYPILRFSESFPVQTILLDRPDQPSLGAGEAAAGPTGAAIANAVHDAVGVRLRDLPFTPDRVLGALNAVPDE